MNSCYYNLSFVSICAGNPDFDVEGCREELITFYKTHMGFIQLVPWDDETEAMDAMFVNLELTHERTRRTNNQCGRLLSANEELFTLETWEGKKVNRVLISGGPGSGKSTLFAKLAYDWAQQKENSPLSRFALLFLLSFREMTESTSTLTGAIFDQLLPIHSKVTQPDLEKYIRSNPSSCLILADGFDERSSGVISSHPDNDIENILAFRDYRECFLLMSSRPHKIYNLGPASKIYTQVSLTGFSDKNINTYIHRFFVDDRDSAESLILKISKSRNLQKLSKIPYMLLLLCLIWSEDKNLPDTQTRLYQQAIFFMWKRYCFKQNIIEETDSDEILQEQLDALLIKLGESVFKSVSAKKEEQILFPQSTFSKDAFEKACAVGVLTKEKLRSKLQGSPNIAFVHKSFQEFCVACYAVHMAKTNQIQFNQILATVHGRDDVSKLFEILMFACGLNIDVAEIVLEHLAKVFDDLSPEVCYVTHGKFGIWPLFVFARESGISYEILHDIFQPLFTSSILISPESLSDQEWVAFEIFLQSASRSEQQSILHTITALDCGDFLASDCIRLLTLVLSKMVPRLKSLVLRSASEISPQVPDDISNLAEAITRHPLLSDITIDVTESLCRRLGSFNLNSFLSKIRSKELARLEICDCKNHKLFFKMDDLTSYLSSQSVLSSFAIFNLDLDSQKAKSLFQTLEKTLDLRQLRISGTCIQEAVKEIDTIVPGLEHLQLSSCELADQHINEFGVDSGKLKVLNLSQNVFSDCRKLSVQLKYCQALEELILSYAQITSGGIELVSQSLPCMPHLKVLDVRYNMFSLRGLEALFKNLHFSERLKKFHCGPCQVPEVEPCSPHMSKCLSIAGVDCPVVRTCHKVIFLEIDDPELINKMFYSRSWETPLDEIQEESEGNMETDTENESTAAQVISQSNKEDIIPPQCIDDLTSSSQEHKTEVTCFELEEKAPDARRSSVSIGCRCILV